LRLALAAKWRPSPCAFDLRRGGRFTSVIDPISYPHWQDTAAHVAGSHQFIASLPLLLGDAIASRDAVMA
jgi:hypothetical protein